MEGLDLHKNFACIYKAWIMLALEVAYMTNLSMWNKTTIYLYNSYSLEKYIFPWECGSNKICPVTPRYNGPKSIQSLPILDVK